MLQLNTVKSQIHHLLLYKGVLFLTMITSMLLFETFQLIFFPRWTGFFTGLSTILLSSIVTFFLSTWIRRKNDPCPEIQIKNEQSKNNNGLEEKAAFYQKILDADPSLIYVKDRQGNYRYCNQAHAGFRGVKRRDMIGRSDSDALPENSLKGHNLEKDHAVLETGPDVLTSEEKFYDSEGKLHWFNVTRRRIVFMDGEDPNLVSFANDICKLKIYEDRLLYERLHDPLTGLPNLESFKALLEGRKHEKILADDIYALMLLDVDQFRRINETHGYTIGDLLMVAVSKRLSACIRSTDTIIRLKGDEFVLLIDELNNHEEVNHVIQRIYEKMSQPFIIRENEYSLSVSIGIIFGNGEAQGAEEMLRDAEIAMNMAKVQGAPHHVVFDECMRMNLTDKLCMEADLRKAVQQGELKLHYQPIISHETGKVTIVEALIRWQHPQRGLIYPNDFIQLAEESELILQMGEWVLREACRQTRIWQTRYPAHQPLTVSVNISSKQLLHTGFIEQVQRILTETGLDAHHLKMEITESIFLGKSDQVIQVLTGLNDIGVQLYIDDFGTGYSSLSYLSQIPFDAIKIDRSFIDGVINRDGDMKIVEAIVRLAFDLGKDLVAEGVETIEQREWLQKLGCKYEQGFLFSRPVISEEIEKFFLSV